jgi:hypothetical protein
VYQARGMQGTQAFRQPGGQRQHGTRGQRPAVADHIGQRRRGDVRRGQPRHRSVQIRVDHGHRDRSAHRPGRGDLGPESGIGGQAGRDDRHRDAFPVRRTAQERPAMAAVAAVAVLAALAVLAVLAAVTVLAVRAELPEQPVRPDRLRRVVHQWHYHPDPHSKWRLEPFLPLCQVLRY